jgi:hypothetical protein
LRGQDKDNDTAVDGAAGSAAGSVVGQKRTRNRQKRYGTQELKRARDAELRRQRAAAKVGLEERFLAHRARLEKRKGWRGPRKFGEWMWGLAERELEQTDAGQRSIRAQLDQIQEEVIATHEKRAAVLESSIADYKSTLQIVDDYIETKWQKKIDAELARRPPPEIE